MRYSQPPVAPSASGPVGPKRVISARGPIRGDASLTRLMIEPGHDGTAPGGFEGSERVDLAGRMNWYLAITHKTRASKEQAKMLDLRHLRHALVLAEHKSYARASTALHLSQSALSRSIASLEETLDVRLFDRGHGDVTPTPYGKALLRRAREMLLTSEELVRDLRLLQGVEVGELDVGVGPHAALISVGTALARLVEDHPGLKVKIEVHDWRLITQYVLDGTVDFGLAETSVAENDSRLEVEPIAHHRAVFFCRPDHPLLKRHGSAPPLDSIMACPLVGPSVPARATEAFQSADGNAASDNRNRIFSPDIVSGDFSMAKQVVLASDAVSFAPLTLIGEDIESGQFVPLFVDKPWMRYGYGFIRERGRTLAPSALAFMQNIREIEAEAARRDEALFKRHAAGSGVSAAGGKSSKGRRLTRAS